MANSNGGGTSDKRFQVITSALDDCRRLIAAGKAQRWDVVKWGVTVNVGLAAAAATLGHSWLLFGLAVAVTIAGLLLVGHYNKRMTGARQLAITLVEHLKSYDIDYNLIMGINASDDYSSGEYYDWPELLIFSSILILSPFLVLLSLSR